MKAQNARAGRGKLGKGVSKVRGLKGSSGKHECEGPGSLS